MKKFVITTVTGILLIVSLIVMSACMEYPFQNIIDRINPDQLLNENHYLNDPQINNPDFYYNDNNLNNNPDELYDQSPINDTDNTTPNDDATPPNTQNPVENPPQNPPAPTQPIVTEPVDKNIKEGKDTLIKALVSLSIRSAPSSTATRVGTIIPGAMVPYVAETNAYWYETSYKGKKAYISKSYTEITHFNKAKPQIEKVIDEAKLLLGFPYVYGAQRYHWGNGKLNYNFVMGQFDCSSLTQYAYYKGANILLDLTTRTQVHQGKAVARNDIQRGDLMFFTNSSRRHLTGNERVGHVAIYLGNNYILHTASTYAIIEPISSTRWNDYITSRRFL